MIELITFILVLSTAIAFAVPAYVEDDFDLLTDFQRRAYMVGAAPFVLTTFAIEVGYDCIAERSLWPLVEGWDEMKSEAKDMWHGR
jgi:hypothetical protein